MQKFFVQNFLFNISQNNNSEVKMPLLLYFLMLMLSYIWDSDTWIFKFSLGPKEIHDFLLMLVFKNSGCIARNPTKDRILNKCRAASHLCQ